jgi:hypothetical protein
MTFFGFLQGKTQLFKQKTALEKVQKATLRDKKGTRCGGGLSSTTFIYLVATE